MKFYLYKKGSVKCLSHTEGGTHIFEVVLTQELDVVAILKGGRTKFPPFKGEGYNKFYLVLRVGGRKQFWTHDFPKSRCGCLV